MFGLVTLDNRTFLIVKKEIIQNGGLPDKCPFETYGFIYKQQDGSKAMFSIITNSHLTKEEEAELIQQALDESKAIFKGSI